MAEGVTLSASITARLLKNKPVVLAILVLALAGLLATPGLVNAATGTNDLMFTPVEPCAAFDTRTEKGGTGEKTISGNPHYFDVDGESTDFSGQGGVSSGCGVPDGSGTEAEAEAVLLNLVALDAQGSGNLRIYAADESSPQGGVVVYKSGLNNSNAVVAKIADDQSNGDIAIDVNGDPLDIRGVVLGYYQNVTDNHWTKTQADNRFARDFHDHDIVQVDQSGGFTAVAASSTETIVSTTYSIDDECILAGDNHNLVVRVTGNVDENTDLDVDLFISIDGDERQISRQEHNGFEAESHDTGFALQELITRIDTNDDGTEDSDVGSGDHTIAFSMRNDDSDDSTSIGNVVMTIEHQGWTCDPIILLGAQSDSENEAETSNAPDGSERNNEIVQHNEADSADSTE